MPGLQLQLFNQVVLSKVHVCHTILVAIIATAKLIPMQSNGTDNRN